LQTQALTINIFDTSLNKTLLNEQKHVHAFIVYMAILM